MTKELVALALLARAISPVVGFPWYQSADAQHAPSTDTLMSLRMSTVLYGQKFVGTVLSRDRLNHPLANATIHIYNDLTNHLVSETTTDGRGVFIDRKSPTSGSYRLVVSGEGIESQTFSITLRQGSGALRLFVSERLVK